MSNRPVYKNVRFKDLIPGETYRVKFKAFSSEGDRWSTRELQYQFRNSFAISQIYYFLDLASGQLLSMYRRMTEPLLELVTITQREVFLLLRSTSQIKYTLRLGAARGRDL